MFLQINSWTNVTSINTRRRSTTVFKQKTFIIHIKMHHTSKKQNNESFCINRNDQPTSKFCKQTCKKKSVSQFFGLPTVSTTNNIRPLEETKNIITCQIQLQFLQFARRIDVITRVSATVFTRRNK